MRGGSRRGGHRRAERTFGALEVTRTHANARSHPPTTHRHGHRLRRMHPGLRNLRGQIAGLFQHLGQPGVELHQRLWDFPHCMHLHRVELRFHGLQPHQQVRGRLVEGPVAQVAAKLCRCSDDLGQELVQIGQQILFIAREPDLAQPELHAAAGELAKKRNHGPQDDLAFTDK